MDEVGKVMATIQASIVTPIMYKMVHTETLPKFMEKKIAQMDDSKKKLVNGFLDMFGLGGSWITKKSIYNQFYSDLVTKVQHNMDVPNTKIHVFYATKMGKNMKRDTIHILRIRIFIDLICSMKNCFVATLTSG